MNAFCNYYVFFIFILLYCFTLFFNSNMMKLQLAALILLVTSLVITEAYFLRPNNMLAYSRKRGSILEKKRISDKNFEGKFIVTSSTFTGIEKPKNNHNNHGYQKYDIYQYRQISVQQQQFADVWPAARGTLSNYDDDDEDNFKIQ